MAGLCRMSRVSQVTILFKYKLSTLATSTEAIPKKKKKAHGTIHNACQWKTNKREPYQASRVVPYCAEMRHLLALANPCILPMQVYKLSYTHTNLLTKIQDSYK